MDIFSFQEKKNDVTKFSFKWSCYEAVIKMIVSDSKKKRKKKGEKGGKKREKEKKKEKEEKGREGKKKKGEKRKKNKKEGKRKGGKKKEMSPFKPCRAVQEEEMLANSFGLWIGLCNTA